MSFPPVDYATYQALRDEEISHPDVEGGGWKLGHATSWARWGERGDLAGPVTASSPEEFVELQPMTTSVVLFAINWGGKNPPSDPTFWQTFHSPGHRGDGALRNSVRAAYDEVLDSSAPVAYMSDVFKLVPTRDAGALRTTLRDEQQAGRDHVERCAELLTWELITCREGADGRTPVVVGMGDAAFEWLSGTGPDTRIAEALEKALGPDARSFVRRMPHYTFGSATNHERTTALTRILREVLDDL
ncbi:MULTISPECIES: hypothetical protein [unclassified Rathayibacter]|uniref:hypothetical protein n=2 Tax=unclassified Rathayibacter TaxID=2609250 RepID=UPI000CE9301F|nr:MULTISPECIES: hypothetical protein [unclassified Rathayibacter]PPH74517.1 hypothetical protein C5C90_10480 [Rathayibacter sp. AY1D4]PPH88934.1 hypothetical protein C5C64_11585 [Rathayibacter sp. AY1D3]PPH19196.1 hypothetical protein C5C35_00265 [Rathayibacter sp. AY1F8]PPH28779.1 hypothetical protein C5C37_09605 [Rathayibacter sp. AY1F9]PPH46742.1 hypothetical protein C5D09_07320 [Rathayibacter sp. AY1C9]